MNATAQPDGIRIGGIVLCGGRSSRMGTPKADLRFGEETMLQRICRVVHSTVQPVVVVAARNQSLSELPPDVSVVRDESDYRGPLAGLHIGLQAIADDADAAFVTGCDVPFLKPGFVREVCNRLGDHEIAVPRDGKFHQSLAAVYRTSLVPRIDALLSADRLRPLYLIEESDSCIVDVEELRAADAELVSLRNLNTNDDYQAALKAAGLETS